MSFPSVWPLFHADKDTRHSWTTKDPQESELNEIEDERTKTQQQADVFSVFTETQTSQ